MQKERNRGAGMGVLAVLGYLLSALSFAPIKGETAEENANVSIREEDGRTAARVTLSTETQDTDAPLKNEGVKEAASRVEGSAFDALSTSNKIVARGADETVEKVRAIGDSAFSWLFRALDVQTSSHPNPDLSDKQK